ncbi:deoxyxylulose-5-phosphate synthase [Streptomyces tropicalis]|uniref:Deoxyxylulose-5-phosphate synthase n=1 Tax=Streptomyces tropicalis TaxID=3034234 RepID=A0ABT6A2A8_9ACTN|nr:deoxyxylulose-5-phosphate synthase [Streptomyces tropicalis]MDF3298785.1 deoxyxylulose-5-phosphate synthase [Streptomyces tropicalis]
MPCRASYSRPPTRTGRTCPRCARPLIHVGSAFAAPPRRDRAAWRVLSVLLQTGIGFRTDCCSCGPGHRPRTLREVGERTAHARRTGGPLARPLVRAELP